MTPHCILSSSQKAGELDFFSCNPREKNVQVHKCAYLCHTVLCLSVKWVQLRCQLNLGISGPTCCPLALFTCTSLRGRHRRVLHVAVVKGVDLLGCPGALSWVWCPAGLSFPAVLPFPALSCLSLLSCPQAAAFCVCTSGPS